MHCPNCHTEDTKVIDSRSLNVGASVRRRRKCEKCSWRFTTYEHIELQLPTIIKRDGRRENFNHEKLLNGLRKSSQKRPISTEILENIVEELEVKLSLGQQKEVPSEEIGSFIMQKLKGIDPVAFVRYASFYWDYENIEEFLKVLKASTFRNKTQRPTTKEISYGQTNSTI
jgi:transcriptional repressor NrdR